MYLQHRHLESLRKDALSHKRRIDELRRAMSFMEDEAEVHETLLSLLDTEEIMAVLGRVLDEPDLADSLANLLPENVRLGSVAVDASADVATGILSIRSWRIEVRLSRDNGVSLRPLNRGQLHQVKVVVTS